MLRYLLLGKFRRCDRLDFQATETPPTFDALGDLFEGFRCIVLW